MTEIIIFITFDFILLTIFWYYISVFCAVYKNTQLFLIKDSLISYSISMILPFITCLISPIFRYIFSYGVILSKHLVKSYYGRYSAAGV